ncbi:MAG: hypothetical protein AVDCRST_MAG02-4287 [uncultured Rubrobacteraceae bacterium]|uniref:Uncharacterized protein n=1 Tax=uncultured Rubrobacteraceae bacterium TaxID=349277 RepID=A0A6J4RIS1_9ACTN|nr:MAG: hypothetical protein AVDCRST_MAG02-4287 [uncultured Rubrobacteraceae bacterium]
MPRQAAEAAGGKLLASSLWLSGFARNGPPDRMPHVLVGAIEVLAAGTSKAR